MDIWSSGVRHTLIQEVVDVSHRLLGGLPPLRVQCPALQHQSVQVAGAATWLRQVFATQVELEMETTK